MLIFQAGGNESLLVFELTFLFRFFGPKKSAPFYGCLLISLTCSTQAISDLRAMMFWGPSVDQADMTYDGLHL